MIRRRACVAAIVAVAACAIGQGVAEAAATSPPWGFHDFIWRPQTWYPASPLTTDQTVQASAADGASIDRLMLGWGWTEPQNDRYDWRALDPAYQAMAARGIRPVVTVYGTPDWARDTSQGLCPNGCAYRPTPDHYGDWQSYLQALIKHLQSLDQQYPGFSGPMALEVWNEPNLRRFFYPGPDPAAYVELLKRARKAATVTGFTKPIVSGGLAPATETIPGQKIAADEFLQTMYGRKLKFQSYADGIGIHPYPKGSTDLTAQMNGATHYGVDVLDAIRKLNGDTHPFWITEMGVSSVPCSVPDCSGPSDPRSGVDGEAAQGAALVDMYNSLATRPVSAFIIFDFEATDPPNTGFSGYGVVDTSGGSIVPKQSFCVLGAQIGNGNPGYGC
jgi:hypothetical protein